MFELNGLRVLVTGATGHLGSAMSWALAEAGAHVLVNSRSVTKADRLVEALEKAGLSAEPAIFDALDDASISEYAELNAGKEITALVNNAYAGKSGSIELSTSNEYMESYQISVAAAHSIVRTLLPAFRLSVARHGYASVINLGSMYGLVSPDQRMYENAASVNPPFYGAAKAALIHWTKYAACEFGKEGIRFNSVSPGPFPSKAVQDSNGEFVQTLAGRVPLGRVGQACEIGGPIVFLASRASSYVNGSNLAVDGGWTSW